MGSEPYTLRGILSKGAWALMTRLGPSPEEGPATQHHIGRAPNMTVSEFYHTYIILNQQGSGSSIVHSGTMCSIERRTTPSDRAVAQKVFYQPVQCIQ